MIVEDFKQTCDQYSNFEIWDVESMDAFLNGNGVFAEMLNKEYKIPIEEFIERRSEIEETDRQIMIKMLEQVGDKHFFIFTLHDSNHMELIEMQTMNIMSFGINIEEIQPDHAYILIMDKKGSHPAMTLN